MKEEERLRAVLHCLLYNIARMSNHYPAPYVGMCCAISHHGSITV